MTTVADIALQVAQEVMDVVQGISTGGSTTTLADTVLLASYPNDHWNNGRLFIKSGLNAGRVLRITDFVTTTGVVTISETLANAILASTTYAIIRNAYPLDRILQAIQRALDGTWVTAENATLTGDGTTTEFTLPAGVSQVLRVENASYGVAAHCEEIMGKLRFQQGFAPAAEAIRVYYKGKHTDITSETVVINPEINATWLKFKASQELLWWGATMYGSQVEYRIEERMNKVIDALKNKSPHNRMYLRLKPAGAL